MIDATDLSTAILVNPFEWTTIFSFVLQDGHFF